jgi:hypothetical protein
MSTCAGILFQRNLARPALSSQSTWTCGKRYGDNAGLDVRGRLAKPQPIE